MSPIVIINYYYTRYFVSFFCIQSFVTNILLKENMTVPKIYHSIRFVDGIQVLYTTTL